MKYNRNRTESLTIRLTPAEKETLKTRAAAKHITVTDYLLLSALCGEDKFHFRQLLQKLSEAQEHLTKINTTVDPALCDALDLNQKTCAEIMKAVRNS